MSLEFTNKTSFAADIVAHESISDVFVVTQAQQFQAKNGPFWRLTLQDVSGSIEGKIWSPLALEFSEFPVQTFYAVTARSSVYKDKVELSINSITPLSKADISALNLADFVPVSPFSPSTMMEDLKALCAKHISHPSLERFFALLLNDENFVEKFQEAPAAKVMHHAYAGGLLEHTLSICRLCMSIADNYPTLDRQVLLAGAICHDMGKIWELTSGVGIDYTDEGRLIGHINLGIEKMTPYMQDAGLEPALIMHIQHLILSHHGTHEFGAPRLPSTAEAFVLHFADNIDAKMQQVSESLDGVEEAGWSGFIRGLDRAVFNAPHATVTSDVEGTCLGHDTFCGSSTAPQDSPFLESDEPCTASLTHEDAIDHLSEDASSAMGNSFEDDPVESDGGYFEALIHDDSLAFENTEEASDEFITEALLAMAEQNQNACSDTMVASLQQDEVTGNSTPDGIHTADFTHPSEERVTKNQPLAPLVGANSDNVEKADENPELSLADSAKTGSKTSPKQPSLPLLEQCSLLSKE